MVEEDFEESWKVLRRNSTDRSPTKTLHIGEALSQISLSIYVFLMLEGVENRTFSVTILPQRKKDTASQLLYAIRVLNFANPEILKLFEGVNKLPLCEELEEAVEHTFLAVRDVLRDYYDNAKDNIEEAQEKLDARKATLLKHGANLSEMGFFEPEPEEEDDEEEAS